MVNELKDKKISILGEIGSLSDILKKDVSKDVIGYINSRLAKLKAELDNVEFLLKETCVTNNYSVARKSSGFVYFNVYG
ncbi:MAG: hypothetical protein P8Y23_09960 [Candidatus Lokiarchaeota archaeon]